MFVCSIIRRKKVVMSRLNAIFVHSFLCTFSWALKLSSLRAFRSCLLDCEMSQALRTYGLIITWRGRGGGRLPKSTRDLGENGLGEKASPHYLQGDAQPSGLAQITSVSDAH